MSVLTPQEYVDGKIPKKRDFRNLEVELRDFYSANDENITSMLVYGSFSRGDYTPSSDVDILVIYDGDKALYETQKLVRDVKDRRNIDLEVNIFQQDFYDNEIHTLIPCFNQHLINAVNSKALNFGNIDQIRNLNTSSSNIRKSAISSLEYRMSEIGKKAMWNDDYSRSKFLKHILQSPFHMMRLYIQTQEPSFFKDKSDMKEIIQDKFLQLVLPEEDSDYHNSPVDLRHLNEKELNLITFLDTIKTLKQKYLHLLNKRINGIVNSTEYEELLDDVEVIFPQYLSFGRTIIEKVKSKRFKFTNDLGKTQIYSPFSE